jgi:hypothetical protein
MKTKRKKTITFPLSCEVGSIRRREVGCGVWRLVMDLL